MAFDLALLEDALKDEGFFREWIYREEVPSTMDLIRERAEAGAPEGTVAIARRQTAGRGRRGRSWASPEGGAWFSLLLRPPIELGQAGCLSVLLAVAVAWALRERYSVPVSVKWPNDLFLEGMKLGGVLIELSSTAGRIDWIVAGMGINVNNPIPPGLESVAVSLAEALEREVALEDFYIGVLRSIVREYRWFLEEGFELVRARWEDISALEVGEEILVQRGGERFEARVRGLSELGRLLIERAGRVEELVSEDVTLSLTLTKG